MSAPPYMKLYVGDYLGDTHHLGVAEHGAYLLLLMSMWRAGGSLPAADANLAKLAKCSPEQWAEIKPAVMVYFRVSRGRITQKRLGREFAKYEDVSRKRSAAVQARENKKTRENNVDTPSNDGSIDHQKIAKPEPEPEPKKEQLKLSVIEGRSNEDLAFDVFWALYPRKVGKLAARKAFKPALKRAGNIVVISDALDRAHWPADPQFIPHPATWLNEGRWMDGPLTLAKPKQADWC